MTSVSFGLSQHPFADLAATTSAPAESTGALEGSVDQASLMTLTAACPFAA